MTNGRGCYSKAPIENSSPHTGRTHSIGLYGFLLVSLLWSAHAAAAIFDFEGLGFSDGVDANGYTDGNWTFRGYNLGATPTSGALTQATGPAAIAVGNNTVTEFRLTHNNGEEFTFSGFQLSDMTGTVFGSACPDLYVTGYSNGSAVTSTVTVAWCGDGFADHSVSGFTAVDEVRFVSSTSVWMAFYFEEFTYTLNNLPTSANATVTTLEDTTYTFKTADFSFSDADGQSMSRVGISTIPAVGTLKWNGTPISAGNYVMASDIAAGLLTYTPAANGNGTGYSSFTFKVHDGIAYSASAYTMTVDVTGVNDAPSFTKGSNHTVNEDAGAQTVTNWATAISAGPSETQTVTFTASNSNNDLFSVQPTISADGTLTYTPAPNTNGSSTVTVTLSDNGGTANGGADTSASQTFTITVNAVNDAPSAASATITTSEDTASTGVGPTVTDVDNASHTIAIATQPAHGTASVVSNKLVYTPAANYSGSDSFNFTATDAGGLSVTGIASVTVTAVNDAPASAQESYSVDFGSTLSVDAARGLLANDSDIEGDTLSAVLASGPAYGSLSLSADGSFSYTHNGINSVDDSFTYQAYDGSAYSAVTTVSLALRTVSSDPGVLSLSPRVARFAPVTVGSYSAPLLFTLKNVGSSAHTIGAVNFGGPSAAEFSLQSDGCSGQSLGAGVSCTIGVSFAPATTGSKAATLEVNTDEFESPVRVAFLTNAEGAAEVAERRLPPVLRSYVLYPAGQPGSPVTTLTSGSTYTLEWVVLGYADSYLANAALFDCRAIIDGSCGDQYDDAERFDASGNLSPAVTANGDWSYGGELARAYTYRYTFTVPAARFTSAGDIVLRFYQKSALDAQGGLSGISLLVPGGVAERYYDNAGRRIIEEVVP